LERDAVQFCTTIGGTYCFPVHSSFPTVHVDGFVASDGKCPQVCTASRPTDDIHHSEWQQSHNCQLFSDLPNLSVSILRSQFYFG